MVVNSFVFLLFFVVLFFIYYFPLKEKTRAQNILLLLASYFFYGYADIKMLPILIVATLIFYYLGIAINKTTSEKRSSVLTSFGVVLGIATLLYFKYLNFFIKSFADLFESLGLNANIHTFNIIMPIGISFFTFRLISYILEIQRKKIEPTKNLVSFSTYIAFFPCLLSGPIDRPNTFIPQLERKRVFDYSMAVEGMRQILWGMFKKIVVADNISAFTDSIWAGYTNMNGSVLFIGAILYSIQLYADFSGYSDMAIGVSKVLGIKVAVNFKYPFFTRNIAEFWRNWHISLTTWLTDYVFMPLNLTFRNYGNLGIIMAILINFFAIGMWHGANYTFALFGIYHGLLYIPLIISGSFASKSKLKLGQYGMPQFQDFLKIVTTFLLATLGFIIFRSDSILQAVNFVTRIFVNPSFDLHFFFKTREQLLAFAISLFSIFLLFSCEWSAFRKKSEFYIIKNWKIYLFVLIILFLGAYKNQLSFIYFNF